MRSKLILCLLLLLLFLFATTISAQMTPSLVEPSAEEYLSTVVELYEQIDDYSEQRDLRAIIQVEVDYRYGVDALSYDELKIFGFFLRLNSYWYNSFFYDIDGIHYAIVEAYMSENNISLEVHETLSFDEYILNITPIDFSGDGQSEYLIDTTWNENSHHAYWIVENTDTGYQRVKTPQLWFDESCDFRSVCGGGATIVSLDDINADGGAELVLAVGGYCGYGFCGGHLSVLGWQNSEIVNIIYDAPNVIELAWASGTYSGGGQSPNLPPDSEWLIDNIDDDPELEILEDRYFRDNHACRVLQQQRFDWDGTNYIGNQQTETLDDSLGCSLRASFLAMDDNRYANAIGYYQRVIELTENTDDGYEQEVHQFAQIRLAIANALLENVDIAKEQIELLNQIEPEVEILRLLIEGTQTYLENNDPIAMCWAVQESITGAEAWSFSSDFDDYAGLDDLARTANYAVGRSSPRVSGCDTNGYLIYRLSQEEIAINQSPIPTIEAFGLTVSDSITLNTNQDNVDDWFIWVEELSNQGFLFVSNEGSYEISIFNYQLPTKNTDYAVRLLPDGTQTLVIIQYPTSEALCTSEMQSGTVTIFKSINNGVPSYTRRSFSLCEMLTLDDFDFTAGSLDVWSSEFEPVSANWTGTDYSYRSSPTRQQRIEERGVFSCGITGLYFCGFNEENPESAIQIIDTYNSDPETASIDAEPSLFYPNITIAMAYRRALALEQLGHDDEVLIAYQELSESDTIWGQMADLHLAPQN